MYFFKNAAIVLTLVMSLMICVTPQGAYAYDAKDSKVSDPIEGVNRVIYGFNMFLDKILIKPIAKAYKKVVPELGRKGISNLLQNLTEPVTLANSILQGDVEHSFITFWRFTVNTTIGVGGLFDVANKGGLKHRDEDFGQTLGKYGVGNGPYLMMPIMGPTNLRDLFGGATDSLMDPYNYLVDSHGIAGRNILNAVDKRAKLLGFIEDIEESSLDPYATIRSLYTQKRLDEINNGNGSLKRK
jgi:phospholipid-binding lipoprotein MlaA